MTTEITPLPSDMTVKRCRNLLAKRFPGLFRATGSHAPKRPLARKVHRLIRVELPELPPGLLAKTLAHYCTRPSYLAEIVEGAARFNLDGTPVEHDGVTQHDQDDATARLKRWGISHPQQMASQLHVQEAA